MDLTAGFVSRSCTAVRPSARTSSNASTALTVVAAIVTATPVAGPNNSPALRVNTVRGTGAIVNTAWVRKNTTTNDGPIDSAHSRTTMIDGRGTRAAATASIASAATVARTRRSRRIADTVSVMTVSACAASPRFPTSTREWTARNGFALPVLRSGRAVRSRRWPL